MCAISWQTTELDRATASIPLMRRACEWVFIYNIKNIYLIYSYIYIRLYYAVYNTCILTLRFTDVQYIHQKKQPANTTLRVFKKKIEKNDESFRRGASWIWTSASVGPVTERNVVLKKHQIVCFWSLHILFLGSFLWVMFISCILL